MGERLVVTIKAFDKEIATIYYHWSAHSVAALHEVDDLISNVSWDKAKSTDELILMLTRHLEDNGGGVDQEDIVAFNQRFNEHFKTEGIDRNFGLIAITENTMNDQIEWSAGGILIDFDEQIIDNHMITYWDSFDEYVDNRRTWDDDFNPDNYKNIKELPIDPGVFYFEELRAVIEELSDFDILHTYDDSVYESYLW